MIAALALLAALAASSASVTGDFDGDGQNDVAELRAEAGGGAALVFRAATGQETVVQRFPAEAASNIYLAIERPGVVKTWCGKTEPRCARPTVTLTAETLAFGSKEASAFVALWTGARFDIVAISD